MKHKLESNEHFHQKLEKSIPDETNKIFLMTLVKDILPRIYIYIHRPSSKITSIMQSRKTRVRKEKKGGKEATRFAINS